MVSIPTPEEQAEYKRSADEVRRSLNFSTYFLRNPPPSNMPLVDSIIAQRFGAEEVGSIFWLCLLAIIFGGIDWYRHGLSIHIGIVAIGTVVSLVMLILLVIHCVKMIQVQSRPTVVSMIFYTILSFVPYVFALYLIYFLGIYLSLTQFSLDQFIQSLFFIVIGHCIAKKLRRLQEFQSCIYEQLGWEAKRE